MNRSETLLLAVSGGLVLIAGGFAVTRGSGKAPPADPAGMRALVDRLDTYVQRRFATVDGVFGVSRIGLGPHDVWTLMPGPEPKAIATAFERGGLPAYLRTVALKRGPDSWGTPVRPAYTARTRIDVPVRFSSREQADSAMKGSPGTYRDLREIDPSTHHQSLSNPVRIAVEQRGEEKTPELPELRAGIQQSIRALNTASSYTFRSGDWEVVARPIKAGAKKCLSCHQDEKGQPARLNDTLGLALYLLRPARPGQRLAVVQRTRRAKSPRPVGAHFRG